MTEATEFKIEKGIPFPKCNGAGKPEKYPWSKLEVGDSFLIAGQDARSVSPLTSAASKRHKGRKYSVRTVDGGVRVWRIK